MTKTPDEKPLIINTMNISKANLHQRLNLSDDYIMERGSMVNWEQKDGHSIVWVIEALRDERYYLYRQIEGSIRYDPPD